MPLEKRQVLTIFVDMDPFISGYLYFHGVMGLFICLMFPEPYKIAVWRLCFYLDEWPDMERITNSIVPERAKEVATGVKTLVIDRLPSGAFRRKEEPDRDLHDEYLKSFEFLKRKQQRCGVKWSLERVVLKGGFERSWVEKVKEILEVDVVCEEYLTLVGDEVV